MGTKARIAADYRMARKTEAERARQRKARLDAACAVWKKLNEKRQMDVVEEIVRSRSEELCRAYEGVVAIAAGYATARRRGMRQVLKIPCVKFMVARKWEPGESAQKQSAAVPKQLLAFCTLNRRRMLCAVPTDVESSHRIRAQSERVQVTVSETPGGDGVNGNVTCVVRLPDNDTRRFALSCRHVLGMTALLHPRVPVGADVVTRDAAADHVADVGRFYGVLKAGGPVSFDAALAEISEGGAPLQRAVPKLKSSGHAKGLSQIKAEFEYDILTHNGAKRAKWVAPWLEGVGIEYDGIDGKVFHKVVLVQSELTEELTEPGDSGAPVVSKDRETLLGMHIAGDGSMAYMIPAFELVRTSNYGGLAAGKFLRITTNY